MKISLKSFFVRICFPLLALSTSFFIAPAHGTSGTSAEASASPTSAASTANIPPEVREYYLKAAFLRYVIKYVEWPQGALPANAFNLCVLGQVPSYPAIHTINGIIVNDRTIAVKEISNIKDAKEKEQCNLIFLSKTEENYTKDILNLMQNESILTFGDMEAFAAAGGHMNFYIMNNHLAITINPRTVDKSKLKINPRMLRLVTIVPSTEDKL